MKTKKRFRGLSGFDLKCLAMVLMVLDHLHYFFEFTGRIPLLFSQLGRLSGSGFQHLQLNKSSKYRRNAVFFCQIPLSFTLYMLYNYGGLYLIWR